MKPPSHEDEPLRVPKAWHPVCFRCGRKHPPADRCEELMREAESSSHIFCLAVLLGIPLFIALTSIAIYMATH
jgi:hypothetical protein